MKTRRGSGLVTQTARRFGKMVGVNTGASTSAAAKEIKEKAYTIKDRSGRINAFKHILDHPDYKGINVPNLIADLLELYKPKSIKNVN